MVMESVNVERLGRLWSTIFWCLLFRWYVSMFTDRNRGMLMSSRISIIISNNINTVIKSAPNINTIFRDVELVVKVGNLD